MLLQFSYLILFPVFLYPATWTGNGDDVSWSDSSNWDTSSFPNSSSIDVSFLNSTPSPLEVILSEDILISSLENNISSLTITSQSNDAFVLDSATFLNSEQLSLSTSIQVNTLLNYTVSGNGIITHNNEISGNGGITLSNGNIELKAANTYQGPTYIESGSLIYFTPNAIPTSSAVTIGTGLGTPQAASLILEDNISFGASLNIVINEDGFLNMNPQGGGTSDSGWFKSLNSSGEIHAPGTGFIAIRGSDGPSILSGICTGGMENDDIRTFAGSRIVVGVANSNDSSLLNNVTLSGDFSQFLGKILIEKNGMLTLSKEESQGARNASIIQLRGSTITSGFQPATLIINQDAPQNSFEVYRDILINGSDSETVTGITTTRGPVLFSGDITLGWNEGNGIPTNDIVSININGNSAIFTGTLSGESNLYKHGIGTLRLMPNQNNTATGNLVVQEGTISFDGLDSVHCYSGNIEVNENATIEYVGTNQMPSTQETSVALALNKGRCILGFEKDQTFFNISNNEGILTQQNSTITLFDGQASLSSTTASFEGPFVFANANGGTITVKNDNASQHLTFLRDISSNTLHIKKSSESFDGHVTFSNNINCPIIRIDNTSVELTSGDMSSISQIEILKNGSLSLGINAQGFLPTASYVLGLNTSVKTLLNQQFLPTSSIDITGGTLNIQSFNHTLESLRVTSGSIIGNGIITLLSNQNTLLVSHGAYDSSFSLIGTNPNATFDLSSGNITLNSTLSFPQNSSTLTILEGSTHSLYISDLVANSLTKNGAGSISVENTLELTDSFSIENGSVSVSRLIGNSNITIGVSGSLAIGHPLCESGNHSIVNGGTLSVGNLTSLNPISLTGRFTQLGSSALVYSINSDDSVPHLSVAEQIIRDGTLHVYISDKVKFIDKQPILSSGDVMTGEFTQQIITLPSPSFSANITQEDETLLLSVTNNSDGSLSSIPTATLANENAQRSITTTVNKIETNLTYFKQKFRTKTVQETASLIHSIPASSKYQQLSSHGIYSFFSSLSSHKVRISLEAVDSEIAVGNSSHLLGCGISIIGVQSHVKEIRKLRSLGFGVSSYGALYHSKISPMSLELISSYQYLPFNSQSMSTTSTLPFKGKGHSNSYSVGGKTVFTFKNKNHTFAPFFALYGVQTFIHGYTENASSQLQIAYNATRTSSCRAHLGIDYLLNTILNNSQIFSYVSVRYVRELEHSFPRIPFSILPNVIQSFPAFVGPLNTIEAEFSVNIQYSKNKTIRPSYRIHAGKDFIQHQSSLHLEISY